VIWADASATSTANRIVRLAKIAAKHSTARNGSARLRCRPPAKRRLLCISRVLRRTANPALPMASWENPARCSGSAGNSGRTRGADLAGCNGRSVWAKRNLDGDGGSGRERAASNGMPGERREVCGAKRLVTSCASDKVLPASRGEWQTLRFITVVPARGGNLDHRWTGRRSLGVRW
jgi:hypothetical protein